MIKSERAIHRGVPLIVSLVVPSCLIWQNYLPFSFVCCFRDWSIVSSFEHELVVCEKKEREERKVRRRFQCFMMMQSLLSTWSYYRQIDLSIYLSCSNVSFTCHLDHHHPHQRRRRWREEGNIITFTSISRDTEGERTNERASERAREWGKRWAKEFHALFCEELEANR